MPSRRLTTPLRWLLAVAVLASGCTTGAEPEAAPSPSLTPSSSDATGTAPEPVTLRLGVYGDRSLREAWRELAQAYTAAYPHATVEVAARGTAERALEDRAAEALAGTLPDVFLIPSEAAPALSATDVVAPVDELLAERGVLFGDTYVRLGLEAFSAEQRLQCMPVDVSPSVVLYRSDLLPLRRVAGPDEEPVTPVTGWTWEQFTRAARLMGRPGVRGVHVEPSLGTLMALVRSDGADLVDDPRDATTLTFSEDGARAALEQILDVLREPRLTPTPQQLARRDALTRFAQGRLGMLVATRAVLPQLHEAGVDFDVMPLPRLGRPRTTAEVSGLCLAASGRHQEAAADFLAWATAEDGASILAETGAVVPAHVPTLNSPAFLESGSSPRHAEVFVDAVAGAEIHPYVPGWPDVVEAVQSELEELFYAPVIDLDTLLPRIDEQSRGILDPELPDLDVSLSPARAEPRGSRRPAGRG